MALDSNLLLRDGTALLYGGDGASTATAAKDFGKDITALTYKVNTPLGPSETTLKVEFQHSESESSGFETFAELTTIAGSPGDYFRSALSNKRYRRAKTTITGSGATTPGFGYVTIGFQVGAGRDRHY